jgi:hypothetical protein
MNKYRISEQFSGDEELEQFKAITNPVLRTAAAANCFPAGYSYNVKHPITGEDTIYVKSKKPENLSNPYVFFKPNYEAEYRTTADAKGQTVRTFKWTCYALNERTNPEVTPIQKEIYDALSKTLGWKKFADVKGDDILNWQLTNIGTDPDLKEGGMYYNTVSGVKKYLDELQGRPFYMWKPKKASAPIKKVDEEQKRILQTQFPGFSLCSISDSEAGNYVVEDISLKYPNFFEKGTKICFPISKLSAQEMLQQKYNELNAAKRNDKNACRNLIKLYYNDVVKGNPMSDNDLALIKPTVRKCTRQFDFPMLKKQINFMQNATKRVEGRVINYALRESKEAKLNGIISESLFKLKEKKSPKLLRERREVKSQLNYIFENNNFRTKKDIEKFSDNLLGIMVNLRKQGYNERIIAEETDSILGNLTNLFGGGGDSSGLLSFLGKKAGGGVMSTVIETIGSGLLSYAGIDPKGVLGTMILKTISNLSPTDIPKLSDCRFVAGLLTKSVMETIAAQATKSIGGTSMLGSFIENTLFEVGEESEIFQSIKNFIGDKIVCPYLDKKGGIMGAVSGLFTGK